MKGYKVFDSDWKCRGFQYEVGKTYEHIGGVELCEAGFHFCQKLIDCFSYHLFDTENKVAEIEAIGRIKIGHDKCVTDKIVIVRELTWREVLDIVNTGDWNSGRGNSGHRIECNVQVC